MKFANVVFLASGALAAMKPTLVKRQSVSAVNADVGAISASAVALDNLVKGFTSASQSQSLIDAAGNVVDTLNTAIADTKSIPGMISSTDPNLATLIDSITALGKVVSSTVSDLIAKKPSFASFSLCGEVLSQAQSLQSTSDSFENTLIPKLASFLQAPASQIAAPINAALSSAVAAFQSCPAASSAPVSAPTSSGSVSSEPTSTASDDCTTSTAVPVTSTEDCTTSTVVPTTVPETSTEDCTTSTVVPTTVPVTSTWVTSTEDCTTSTSVPTWTPTSNSTWTPSSNVTSPSGPSIAPAQGAGAKQVAGFGGLAVAMLIAVAAL